MINFLFKYLFWLLIALTLVAVVRTLHVEYSKKATEFTAGKVPSSLPGGLYKGTVPGQNFSWQGKDFNAITQRGINVFNKKGVTTLKYPFVFSITKSIRNKHTEVVRIDYNITENPWWLRLIVDEIVEVAPGEYLGKLLLPIIPTFPFTLTYFELKKNI